MQQILLISEEELASRKAQHTAWQEEFLHSEEAKKLTAYQKEQLD